MQNNVKTKYESSSCGDSEFELIRLKSLGTDWSAGENDLEIILDGNSDDEILNFVERGDQNQKTNLGMHRDIRYFKPTLLSPIPEEATERLVTSEDQVNQTLADGNCAFNCISLFFRDCFLNLPSNHHQNTMIIDKLNDIEHYNCTIQDMKSHMQISTLEETQRFFSPVFRRVVVDEMRKSENRYQVNFLEKLQIILEYSLNNPWDINIPHADTFLVHPFVVRQLKKIMSDCHRSLQEQLAQLEAWWSKTGFEQYLKVIESPASAAGDSARWGGEPELDLLGKLFNFKICVIKNHSGKYSLGFLDNADCITCNLNITGNHWSYSGLVNYQKIPNSPVKHHGLFENNTIIIGDEKLKQVHELISLGNATMIYKKGDIIYNIKNNKIKSHIIEEIVFIRDIQLIQIDGAWKQVSQYFETRQDAFDSLRPRPRP